MCCLWKCSTNIETICEKEEKVNHLFAGLESLRIVKNGDSDLKVLALHYANKLFVRVRLSAKSLNIHMDNSRFIIHDIQKQYEKKRLGKE